ncbi:Anaphase-promoting complex subunit cdc20 [Galdieria sulphuraria]|nr:Anaphase-promoting complex subunit cdc20 [Galdieria sulphuraria]
MTSYTLEDFNTPLECAPLARWERKRKEQLDRTSKTPNKTPQGDRFIPNRNVMNIEVSRLNLQQEYYGKENNQNSSSLLDSHMDNVEWNSGKDSPACHHYQSALASSLLQNSYHEEHPQSKILTFKQKAPKPQEGYVNSLKVLYSQNMPQISEQRKRMIRHIPQTPDRILDAPELVDDYYLNLLDWNHENILAVALGSSVYLWNASTGDIQELCNVSQDEMICSVSWVPDGHHLAVGTSMKDVQLWDTQRGRQVRKMHSHSSRVGCLAWNGPILSSGSRDTTIHHHDVRIAQHHVETLRGHEQEVCGLKWNVDGSQLASGGNDNLLMIWDHFHSNQPKYRLDHHHAAVKAIAWCPWQTHLLASGGGTADRTIKFWNTTTGACLQSIDTKSQQSRVLTESAYCVEISIYVSGAGDETLRFWRVFEASESKLKSSNKTLGHSQKSIMRTCNISIFRCVGTIQMRCKYLIVLFITLLGIFIPYLTFSIEHNI